MKGLPCQGAISQVAFYYVSLQTLSVSLGVILFFQYVWMGILLDWFLQRRSPTRNRWIALVFVSIGTALAAGYQTLLFAWVDPLGICFGLLSALCYAVSISVSGRVAIEVPAILRTVLMASGAAIVTLIVFPPAFLVNDSLERGLWIWGLPLGLFGVIIPPFLLNIGTPIIGIGLATILTAIELPIVITLAALVFSEHVQMLQWGGVALILLGVVVAEQPVGLRKRLLALMK